MGWSKEDPACAGGRRAALIIRQGDVEIRAQGCWGLATPANRVRRVRGGEWDTAGEDERRTREEQRKRHREPQNRRTTWGREGFGARAQEVAQR